tara:strand:- start:211 stop:681 length:471 start_codon:yes stop_codon:yes gene_type:complete
MVNIGFTGTQEGMTPSQKESFGVVWDKIKDTFGEVAEFHHGDCVGADEQADSMVSLRFKESGVGCIVIHPPDNDSKRAWCEGEREEKPLPYLDRNTEIVKACDILIAAPKEHDEVLRSGTWATIRRGRKYNKFVVILWPSSGHTWDTFTFQEMREL